MSNRYCKHMEDSDESGAYIFDLDVQALDFALSIFRPVNRKQVEKVWRGEWVHKRSPYDYKIFVCKKCGKQISIQGENMNFCPACGAAQTDEAMQIVMGRLEELYEKTD